MPRAFLATTIPLGLYSGAPAARPELLKQVFHRGGTVMVARHCLRVGVALFVVLICDTSHSQQAAKKENPVFAAGEKVEVWWAGKFLPGEIVTVEGNGWVQVKFAQNGREQTIRQRG